MPYQEGLRLPAERASKLGHLEVIQSPLVKKLCQNFEDPEYIPECINVLWDSLPEGGRELNIIFSSDGSIQILESKQPPFKAISFVKTALLRIDQYALSKLDPEAPNPFALKDIMSNSALFHSTAFPLRHVRIPEKTIYQSVREIIYESIKDPGLNNALDGAMMDTLKWIAYEKWNEKPRDYIEEFGCPHCFQNVATLPYDEEKGLCPNCKKEIFITDMFGFHLNMSEDFAPNQIASDYMSISETLMIFTSIRYFWEKQRSILNNCLFIKDGPLALRATLAKLAAPIRRFFRYAVEQGIEVSMLGQEKSGLFYDHLQLIGRYAPINSVFIPDNTYIQNEIKHSNSLSIYGQDTNYGAKLFIKYNDYHQMVLNIPTGKRGECVESPNIKNLIGFRNIVATLPKLLSNRFEGALLPVELANGVASLSTYPSAKVLELFAETKST